MKTKTKVEIIVCSLVWAYIALIIGNGVLMDIKASKGVDVANLPFIGEHSMKIVVESVEIEMPKIRRITMYNAGDPNQTDNTPCISANGENVCTAVALGYGRCASNKDPFGTRLFVSGLGECIVTDRMNSRYDEGEVDWALPADQYKKAVAFGKQYLLVSKR